MLTPFTCAEHAEIGKGNLQLRLQDLDRALQIMLLAKLPFKIPPTSLKRESTS